MLKSKYKDRTSQNKVVQLEWLWIQFKFSIIVQDSVYATLIL